jgi:methyl-accepting chemotaxis protein
MAGWLFPVVKAILPHVGAIVTAGAPAFTTRKTDDGGTARLMQQQIAELQAAASQNAHHINELAEHLQRTVAAIQQAAAAAESRAQRITTLCNIAIGASVAAVLLSLVAIFAR